MKKKIFAIITCFCLCFCTLFAGCSLVEKDNSADDNKIVMTVGETQITKKELKDQFSSFYNQYYYLTWYGYSEDDLADIFYKSVVSRAIALEKANELLAADTTDPIFFYELEAGDKVEAFELETEYDEIWWKVYDAVNSNVIAKEKSILTNLGIDEEDFPVWLKKDDSTEKAYKYEKYDFENNVEIKPIIYDGVKIKATEPDFDTKFAYLKNKAIFTYNAEKDADKKRQDTEIDENFNAGGVQIECKKIRQSAFNMFLNDLILADKADGTFVSKDKTLKNYVQKLYDAYKDSALYEKYKEYVESNVNNDDDFKITDFKIAERFTKDMNASMQENYTEDNYLKVILSNDNEDLILYHRNSENVYFTVKHILAKYDYKVSEQLAKHEGYSADADKILRDEYVAYRDALIKSYYKGATLDEAIGKITTSYRNEDGKLAKDAEGKLEKITIGEILDDLEDVGLSEDERLKLFDKYVWLYTDDTSSLSNSVSNKLGLTMSSQKDNNITLDNNKALKGSYDIDFTAECKRLFANINDDTAPKELGEEVGIALSTYGVHLIMVTNVFESGKLIETYDSENSKYKYETENGCESLIANMKATKVSSTSSQTIYQFYYELLKNELVGDNGTYFEKLLTNAKVKYDQNSKLIGTKKGERLTYQELLNLIGY